MQAKTVFIVENRYVQMEALRKALVLRDFEAKGALTVAEARQIIEALGEGPDVIVLDMHLGDPNEPDTTGADIGIEIQAQHPDWMPEYLISSAHEQANYYKLAWRLGAATYLLKDEVYKPDDVIRHVRALALKRALRVERPSVAERLRSISESTKNLSEGVRKFCRDILVDELNACLGAPYILLLTDESGTQNFATNTKLPTGYKPVFKTLQIMAHGISNFSIPCIVSEQELKNLPAPADSIERKVFERLPNAALIPLANVMNFRLSLGLLVPQLGEWKYPEDTGQLATVLAQYVRPVTVEHFLRILVHLDSQRRAVMKSASNLCLLLGRDQQEIVEEGIAKHELQEGSITHQKLVTMADDLWQTGTILGTVANSKPKEDAALSEISSLIEETFMNLRDKMSWGEIKFKVEGCCSVNARRDDMLVVVTRLLQWLGGRRMETPPDLEPEISVQCGETENNSQVIFEDRSRRLPEELRQQLFAPFSTLGGPGFYLPLYLAKMLVEEKYGGCLDDRSSDMEGEIGHRIVMRFNLAGGKSAEDSVAVA